MENALRSGISEAQEAGKQAVASGAARAQSLSQQGMDAINEAASQARDAVADVSDSVVAYTKENPVKALAIAAASGALIYALIRLIAPSRD